MTLGVSYRIYDHGAHDAVNIVTIRAASVGAYASVNHSFASTSGVSANTVIVSN